MKEITMAVTAKTAHSKYGHKGGGRVVLVPETVHFPQMSALASAIAESISTTESADDLSLIWVHISKGLNSALLK